MKKALITILLLATSQLFAATKDFSDIPGYLLDKVLFASSFKQGQAPEIEDIYLELGDGQKNNTLSLGQKCSQKAAVRDGLENGPYRSEACTVSFDLLEVEGESEQVVWALYSPGMSFDKGLRIIIGRRNSLILECNQFTHTSLEGRRARRNLGKTVDLSGKTLTVVYDGSKDTIRAYVNGKPAGKAMRLTRSGTINPNRLVGKMTWGNNFGGHANIERITIDNVYYWNSALKDEEIQQLLKFEMTPLYWGIAGGAAGLLLIIAALIIVRLKKKASPAA